MDYQSHARRGRPGRISSRRKGVLLLIVLCMLTLFMLLGTTYIVMATRAKRTTQDFEGDTHGIPLEVSAGRKVADAALKMLVSGSFPAPGGESVLKDMYGSAIESAPLASVTRIGQTDFYLFELNKSASASQSDIAVEEWGGRIACLSSGGHVGRPFRLIVVPNPSAAANVNPKIIGKATESLSDFDPSTCVDLKLSINGVPFSHAEEQAESYDAPDLKNQFLAFVPPEAALGTDGRSDPPTGMNGTRDDPRDGHRYIIPSFHRPDAIMAAVKNAGSWPMMSPEGLMRPDGRMSFRHPPTDEASDDAFWNRIGLPRPANRAGTHPDFTGSNVSRTADGQEFYFDPINGPWDVDNDGDGVTDSVWLDIGAANVTFDGYRKTKPLVAMMVLDMDGRINLNAHGSLAPVDLTPSNGSTSKRDWPYAGTDPEATYPANYASLLYGLGFGPADIAPLGMLNFGGLAAPFAASENWSMYAWKSVTVGARAPLPANALQTSGGISLPAVAADGRYGENPASVQDWSYYARPGIPGQSDSAWRAAAGATPLDQHLPDKYGATSSLGSPIDPRGITAVGLDSAGQPYFTRNQKRASAQSWVNSWQGDTVDDPYDVSLSRKGPRPAWTTATDVDSNGNSSYPDNLLTIGDLERLLRMYDTSASRLSPRIMAIAGPVADRARLTTTTDSWDVTALVASDPLILEKLWTYFSVQNLGIPEHLNSFLSWDFSLGLPMDINRPFGDGIDSDGNLVVDEPTESEVLQEGAGQADGPFVSPGNQVWGLTNGRDVDGSGSVDLADQLESRQLFAKHLYCLGRIVLGSGGDAPTAEELAQWCVNVVDFRDPDSIMTRFDYDPDFEHTSNQTPAWNPTKTCWGVERPELLLTEAIAWNNVTEQQTSAINYSYNEIGTGGFILELYHPWTGRIGMDPQDILASPIPAEFSGSAAVSPFSTAATVALTQDVADRDPAFSIAVVEEMSGSNDLIEELATNPAAYNDPGLNGDLAMVIYPWSTAQASPDTTKLPAASSLAMTFYTGLNAGAASANSLRPGQFAIIGGGQRVESTQSALAHIGPTTSNELSVQTGIVLSATSSQWVSATNITEDTSGYSASNRVIDTAAYPLDWKRGDVLADQPGPLGAILVADANCSGGNQATLKLPLPTPNQRPTPSLYRVLLRRLANPLLRFDKSTNPYVTIDSIVVQQQVVIDNATRPGAVQLTLRSAQRGWSRKDVSNTAWNANNLWSSDDGDSRSLEGQQYPDLGLHCGSMPSKVEWSLGFLTPGLRIVKPIEASDDAVFPWLTWNNREFTSPQELLLIPQSGPATLLRDFGITNTADSQQPPFPHLFFDPETTDPVAHPTRRSRSRLKLFEYLTVRSRFADAAEYIPPGVAADIRNATGARLFYPPHNQLTDVRQAGRVNLNTISDARVWEALNGGTQTTAFRDEITLAGDFSVSHTPSEDYGGNYSSDDRRRGNGRLDVAVDEDLNSNGVLDRNDDSDNDNRQDVGDSTLVGSRRGYGSNDASIELPSIAGNFDLLTARKAMLVSEGDKKSFFSRPFTADDYLHRLTASGAGAMLFDAPHNTMPHNPRDRSPWFRYQSLFRLAPITTVRSNVYAVWITVGFFRTDDTGTTLEEEHDVERVRYFAIIDRSIPAAYSDDKEFDASQVVVLKRWIP